MALSVIHTKKSVHSTIALKHARLTSYSCDLPDDVFTEGEVKPARSSKKKAGGTSKKRGATVGAALLTHDLVGSRSITANIR